MAITLSSEVQKQKELNDEVDREIEQYKQKFDTV